jgi:protein involved in polysaccharide export with SLBB domain
MKNGLTRPLLLLVTVLALLGGGSRAQDRGKFQKENYSMDANQQLLIEVHVWGEVNKPGVFQVPDGSTVLDVISAAGGPTQYAALSRVRLSHTPEHHPRIEPVNLDRYLSNEKAALPQVLKPGDAVMVPRNTRFFWKDAVSLIADIAVIVNVYYLISRNR